MDVYLCALRLYKKAIFSSKKTFTGFVPIFIIPIGSEYLIGSLAGEITDQIDRAFWFVEKTTLPNAKLDSFLADMAPDVESGREKSIWEVIEKAPCVSKKLRSGSYDIRLKGKAKYLTNFTIEFQEALSRRVPDTVWILKGELNIEDYVNSVFDTARVSKRMSMLSKVIAKR